MSGFRTPQLKAIGIAHTPFANPGDVERPQSARGRVEIFSRYADGLKDIDGFSHIILIWLFHKSKGTELQCCPTRYRIPPPRGLFATRSPFRVNPIGLTVVKLLEREGSVLHVKGVDMIEGTPVLDIKPYTRRDRKSNISAGWLDEAKMPNREKMRDRQL